MATFQITYDGRSVVARETMNFMRRLGVFTIREIKEPIRKKCSLELAIEEISQGKVTVCADMDDFLRKINE